MKKIFSILLVLAMTCFATAAFAAGAVSTDGSTSMEKVIGALGESFMEQHSDVNFTYNPTGSGSGITAVQEGRCDIGLSSRALKDDEKAQGLTETVLAYDGIAIIVNPANPVNDLSLETIAKIYTGEITNWSEVGGEDGEIVVIGREAGSGTRDGFESIKDTVKAVTVDGVAPTEETIKDGTYKVQRPFVLVTKDGVTLSEDAQAFFDYATSPEAAEIIAAAGAVAAVDGATAAN